MKKAKTVERREEDRIRLFGIIVKQLYGVLTGVTPYFPVDKTWDSCNMCGFTGLSRPQIKCLRTFAMARHSHDGSSWHFTNRRNSGTLVPTLQSLEKLGFIKIHGQDTICGGTQLTILWTPEQFEKVVG